MIDGAERRMSPSLILKRASASRPSGEWNDDDYDVLADGTVVGRILKVHAAPIGSRREFCMSARSQTSEDRPTLPTYRCWLTRAVGLHENAVWEEEAAMIGTEVFRPTSQESEDASRGLDSHESDSFCTVAYYRINKSG